MHFPGQAVLNSGDTTKSIVNLSIIIGNAQEYQISFYISIMNLVVGDIRMYSKL